MNKRGHLAPERRSRRRPPTRAARRRFLVVCEGRVTEPEYLRYVKHELRDSLLTVEVIGGYTDPITLVETAAAKKREAERRARIQRDAFLRYDETWCLMDVDEHSGLAAGRDLAYRNEIRLAISDPCFELWLLLHFTDHAAYLSTKEAGRRLSTYMANYAKHPQCALLAGRFSAARSRARRLCATDDCCSDTNPTTHIWQLIDSLIDSAKQFSADSDQYRSPL